MAEKKSPQKTRLSELEERRAALKKELEELEDQLEDSLDDIKDDVTSRLEPKYWITKFPLETFGVSVILGFLIGNKGKKPAISENLLQDNLLWSELKRALTRKAIQRIVDIIDSKKEKD